MEVDSESRRGGHRRQHAKRRYLTDRENPSIPKQSRKRWLETECGCACIQNTDERDSSIGRHDDVPTTTTTVKMNLNEDQHRDSHRLNDETPGSYVGIGAVTMTGSTTYDPSYFTMEIDGEINSTPNASDQSEDETSSSPQSQDFGDSEGNIPSANEYIREDSTITKGQAVVTLIVFILRHNLTGVAVEDLLEMLEIIAPGSLPASKFLLNKGLTSQSCSLNAHLYCPVCDAYLGKYSVCKDMASCNFCNTIINRDQCLKEGRFYLYVPIESQLRELLKTHTLIKKSDSLPDESLVNIFSGRMMKGYFNRGEISDSDITLTWNCDGAPVFRSSKRAVWPLQACINEIPRNCKENCLLIGLWFAKEKPWSHCFLQPFVEELKHLGTVGMNWMNSRKEVVHSRVFSICSSCDSCARPMFRNTTQFNGRFGCDWCLQEGEVIERGSGTARIYCLLDDVPEKRTHVQFKEDALASSEINAFNGVKGVSPLLFLPLFDIVRGFVPDYLHCVLLGVVRTFAGLWLDSCNHRQPWYIGQKASEISSKLVNMKIPSSISRLPRSLNERKYWKGSEWKSFLLFYSLLVLQDILPYHYLNHWFLLVFSVNTLLQDKINSGDVDLAEMALTEFVKNVPVLYGREHCTFNVHQLLHLADAVRDWGPLWVFSCFRFEGKIGQLLSLVQGTKCVPLQIFRTFSMQAMLPTLHSKYFTVYDVRLESLLTRLMYSGLFVRKKSNCVDNIHMYGCPAMRHLDMTEVVALSRLYGYYPNQCTYKIYNRFAVNALYMSSVDYKQTNKHSDDTVLLTNDDICVILRCAVGKYFCECKTACNCKEKVLLFVNKIEPPGDIPLFSNRDLHITSNSFLYGGSRNFETVCCEPTEVARKCFRYQQNEKMYVVPLPTTQESDE